MGIAHLGGGREGVNACLDGLGDFLSTFLFCGGSERLPGWFVNVTAQLGNIKKEIKHCYKIHSKLQIFRVKSVKIYTGQKKITRTCPWRP